MADIVYLDTNAFYLLFELYGISLKPKLNIIADHIDAIKIKAEFGKLLLESRVGLTGAVLTEIITNIGTDITIYTKVYSFLEEHINSGKIRYGQLEPFFEFYYKNAKIHLPKYQKEIEEILQLKIKSESELHFLFSFTIVYAYILVKYHKIKNVDMQIFVDVMKSSNAKLVKKIVTDKIVGHLANAYKHSMQKQIIRNVYDDILNDVYFCLAIQLVSIEEAKEDPDQSYLSEILSLTKNKEFSKKLQQWYNKQIKNNVANSDMIEYRKQVKYALDTQGYSVEQCRYMTKMIEGLFSNSKKRDKNDAEDFWFLGALMFESRLLTFDNEIISILEETNPVNFQYINQFLI